MKKLLCILCVTTAVMCMDKPEQKELSKQRFVHIASDFVRVNEFLGLLDSGVIISRADLEDLLPRPTGQGTEYFWVQYGIEFLMRSRFAPAADTKIIGSSGTLSEQARESLFKKYRDEFKIMLRIAKKDDAQKSENKSLLAGSIDEKAVKAAWQTMLAYGNTTLALDLLKDIRQSYVDADKKEPVIINRMTDLLVEKICSNVLSITGYLRSVRKNDELEQLLKNYFKEEIKALKKMGHAVTVLEDRQRDLIGMLTANGNSCPIFVKKQVLEHTAPKKGFVSGLKALFTP